MTDNTATATAAAESDADIDTRDHLRIVHEGRVFGIRSKEDFDVAVKEAITNGVVKQKVFSNKSIGVMKQVLETRDRAVAQRILTNAKQSNIYVAVSAAFIRKSYWIRQDDGCLLEKGQQRKVLPIENIYDAVVKQIKLDRTAQPLWTLKGTLSKKFYFNATTLDFLPDCLPSKPKPGSAAGTAAASTMKRPSETKSTNCSITKTKNQSSANTQTGSNLNTSLKTKKRISNAWSKTSNISTQPVSSTKDQQQQQQRQKPTSPIEQLVEGHRQQISAILDSFVYRVNSRSNNNNNAASSSSSRGTNFDQLVTNLQQQLDMSNQTFVFNARMMQDVQFLPPQQQQQHQEEEEVMCLHPVPRALPEGATATMMVGTEPGAGQQQQGNTTKAWEDDHDYEDYYHNSRSSHNSNQMSSRKRSRHNNDDDPHQRNSKKSSLTATAGEGDNAVCLYSSSDDGGEEPSCDDDDSNSVKKKTSLLPSSPSMGYDSTSRNSKRSKTAKRQQHQGQEEEDEVHPLAIDL
mmetsp:Transcript_25941/g.61540  ORF Transcript_25941/g.61540 Transcript_25941/m.61540 type:complete len:518 (+) Transcript_25941:28-1581(+)